MAAGPLALVALICGWITTEVGRQPWIVYEVMRTRDAVTANDGLELGFAVLVAVYVALGAALAWLLRRLTVRAERGLMAEVCLGLAVLGLTAYAVLGGADFGAGFWDLTAGGDRRGGRVRGLVQRSMSPVWEANHVWLIFVLVMVWTAFPVAFGAIFANLAVPLFLAALGIIARGTAFALRGQAATMAEARMLGAVFALASLLVPFFFGAVLGGIASGRVEVENASGGADAWLNPTSLAVGVLAVMSGAYIAAVFLGGDARRAGLQDLERAFRTRALAAGAVTGVATLASLLVLRSDARPLFDGLTSGAGLAAAAVSALAGRGHARARVDAPLGAARGTAALAVAAVIRRLGAGQPARPAARADHDRRGGRARRHADRARRLRRRRLPDPRPVALVPLPARPPGPPGPGASSRSTSASGRSTNEGRDHLPGARRRPHDPLRPHDHPHPWRLRARRLRGDRRLRAGQPRAASRG